MSIGEEPFQKRDEHMVDIEAAGEVVRFKEIIAPVPETWREWRTRLGKARALTASPEWALRWAVHCLSGLALFKVLELLGRLVVLVALVSWLTEAHDRREAKHNQAWSLIMAAKGVAADGGRKNALENLLADRIALTGAPLQGAHFNALNLSKAQLFSADFTGGRLFYSELEKTALHGAIFNDALLKKVSFKEARVVATKFENTTFHDCDFTNASVYGVNFADAKQPMDPATLATLKAAKLCNVTLPTRELASSGCPEVEAMLVKERDRSL
jgi:hypothetical protein